MKTNNMSWGSMLAERNSEEKSYDVKEILKGQVSQLSKSFLFFELSCRVRCLLSG